MTPWNLTRLVTGMLSPLFLLLPSQAGALQVYAPDVEAGEAEAAFQGDGQPDGTNRQQLELGYGVTPRWFTGLYGVWRQAPHQARRFDAVKWENILLPSGNASRTLPWGIYLEVEQPATSGATEVEIKGLFQKRLGAWEHRVNLIAGKAIEGTTASAITTGYAWRSAWPAAELQWALEGYGQLGQIKNQRWYDHPQHRWGPVLSYRVDETKIEAGYLFHLSRSRSIDTWKLNLEWAF